MILLRMWPHIRCSWYLPVASELPFNDISSIQSLFIRIIGQRLLILVMLNCCLKECGPISATVGISCVIRFASERSWPAESALQQSLTCLGIPFLSADGGQTGLLPCLSPHTWPLHIQGGSSSWMLSVSCATIQDWTWSSNAYQKVWKCLEVFQ
jgi:hypothetical protein